jgi:acyl homoserine lactone synthase
MHDVIVSRQQSLAESDLRAMYQLRCSVFKGRLNWDVAVEGDEERDNYDNPETLYSLGKSADGSVDGCWRVLPTEGPYMLPEVFPELLHGLPPPKSPRIWELSRFAVRGSGAALTRNPLTVQLVAKAVEYARRCGIDRYVTVISVAVERLLQRAGLHIHRLGPPVRIGAALTVACFIEIDDITSRAVSGHTAGTWYRSGHARDVGPTGRPFL